jgi:hypothetical protein
VRSGIGIQSQTNQVYLNLRRSQVQPFLPRVNNGIGIRLGTS